VRSDEAGRQEVEHDRDPAPDTRVDRVRGMYFTWVPFQPEPDDAGAAQDVRRAIVLDPCADRETLVAAIETMTLEQIRMAWRATDRLLTISNPRGASQLARLRDLLLDEVEARHPRAYRRWLRQGGPRRER
jgi:hypothetical protein